MWIPSGVEYEQPADMVILCGYGLMNVRMMLMSGIGKPYDPNTAEGVVGARNYCYQTRRRRRLERYSTTSASIPSWAPAR